MKKFAFGFCIFLILVCFGVSPFDYVQIEKDEEIIPGVNDGSLHITISAVGDCTLGTDANYGGALSFETEMRNVGYDYSHFLKLVKPIFEKDDLTIANFEGTLSERGIRRDKEYAFRGNPQYAKVLTSSSVEAVNLANNHTRDYGEIALSDTKDIMNKNGLLWFEGTNFSITEVSGIKIGLVGSNALTYAGQTQFPEVIAKVKEQGADLVIASFHWGVESAKTPNETQIRIARSAIDCGADLVIGHHPHVLQGVEKYKGKYILYSLGNFCFGGHKNPGDKDTMIFRQTFSFVDGELSDYDCAEAIPCKISTVNNRNNYQPTPTYGTEFERIKNKIINLSAGFSGVSDIKFMEN